MCTSFRRTATSPRPGGTPDPRNPPTRRWPLPAALATLPLMQSPSSEDESLLHGHRLTQGGIYSFRGIAVLGNRHVWPGEMAMSLDHSRLPSGQLLVPHVPMRATRPGPLSSLCSAQFLPGPGSCGAGGHHCIGRAVGRPGTDTASGV